MNNTELTTRQSAPQKAGNPFELFPELVAFVVAAHAEKPRRPENAIRRWDGKTPYAAHPIWCATMLMTESSLPEHVRAIGCQALLLHDILEDTTADLPDSVSEEVCALVREMTFPGGSREEVQEVWLRSDLCKLFKLYDKVSNCLDGAAFSDERWNQYSAYTLKLADFVESKWGQLHIVRIARLICQPRTPQQ